MKRKFLTCMTILSIVCTMASGHISVDNPPKKNLNSKPGYVVDAFIEAHMHTDAKLFSQVLNDGAFISTSHGSKIVKHSKEALVNFCKKQGKTDLNCDSEYEILSSSNGVVMVRVDFKFPTFTQKNFLTIEKGENDNWTITQVNRFNENV